MAEGKCSFAGCTRPKKTRGLCNGHNEQRRAGKQLSALKRKSRASVEEKYEASVERSEDCWGWAGTTNDSGYAVIAKDHVYIRAHRFSWERENGPIPTGMVVDHKCWKRDCTNPSHLRSIPQVGNYENRPGPNRNSTTGVRNVSFDRGKYVVSLSRGGKKLHIGRYPTLEEASARAVEARAENYAYSIL